MEITEFQFPLTFPFRLGPIPAELLKWTFPLEFPLFLGPYAGDDVIVIRKLLEEQLSLTKDDNLTPATFKVTNRFPESKLREFATDVDVVITVGRSSKTVERNEPIVVVKSSFDIEPWSIDHTAVHGLTIRHKAEKEIRRILNQFPHGSFQQAGPTRDDDRLLSSPPLYHSIMTVNKTSYEEF